MIFPFRLLRFFQPPHSCASAHQPMHDAWGWLANGRSISDRGVRLARHMRRPIFYFFYFLSPREHKKSSTNPEPCCCTKIETLCGDLVTRESGFSPLFLLEFLSLIFLPSNFSQIFLNNLWTKFLFPYNVCIQFIHFLHNLWTRIYVHNICSEIYAYNFCIIQFMQIFLCFHA